MSDLPTEKTFNSIEEEKEEDSSSFLQKFDDQQLIDKIYEEYGYGSINLKIIMCLCFSFLLEGINLTLVGTYIIPLTSYYNLSSLQASIISSSFFLAITLGNFISGFLSENYNRLLLIYLMNILIMFFHFGIVIIKNITAFIICRMLVGLFVGILLPLSLNLTNEYLPIFFRCFTITNAGMTSDVGHLVNCLLALIIMPNLEKERIFKCFFYLEIFYGISLVINLIYLRDSPRHILTKHCNDIDTKEVDKAFSILSKMNNNSELSPIERKIILTQIKNSITEMKLQGSLKDIFNSHFRTSSILLIFIWFLLENMIFGLNIVSSLTLQHIHLDPGNVESNRKIVVNLVYSTLIILPNSPIGGLLSEAKYMGRLRTMMLSYFLAIISISLCIFWTRFFHIWFGLTLILLNIALGAITTYSSEIYPTMIRDKAYGFMLGVGRIGGILSQVFFIGLHTLNPFLPYYVSIAYSVICFILVLFLPFETLGQPLDQKNKLNTTFSLERIESLKSLDMGYKKMD